MVLTNVKRVLQRSLAGLLVGAGTFFSNVPSSKADGSLFIYNKLDNNSATNNKVVLRYSSTAGVNDGPTGLLDSPFLETSLITNRPYIYSSQGSTKLSTDARTNDPTNGPFRLNLMYNGTNSSSTTNRLFFYFPSTNPTNQFDGKNITLQECDTNGTPFGPTYDVRNNLTNSNGVLTLGNFSSGNYPQNSPYKQFLLWITNSAPQNYNVSIGDSFGFGVDPSSTNVAAGSTLTASVSNVFVYSSPSVRQRFTGLSGSTNVSNISSNSVAVGPVNSNLNLATAGSLESLVSASSAGNGSVSGSTSNFVANGSNATISANADQFYQFKNWSDGNTNNPRTELITGPTNWVAYFSPAMTSNGVSQVWLNQHNLATDGSVDANIASNNINTIKESYLADLNPTNPLSLFSGGIMPGEFYVPNSSTNCKYTLDESGNLVNWAAKTNKIGNGGNLSFPLDSTNSGHYRARAERLNP